MVVQAIFRIYNICALHQALLEIFVQQMGFNKTRWPCQWNSDQTVHKTLPRVVGGSGGDGPEMWTISAFLDFDRKEFAEIFKVQGHTLPLNNLARQLIWQLIWQLRLICIIFLHYRMAI